MDREASPTREPHEKVRVIWSKIQRKFIFGPGIREGENSSFHTTAQIQDSRAGRQRGQAYGRKRKVRGTHHKFESVNG